ncbi:aquaporin AQPAe.a-like isoform X1 [Eriocheir sinensis]|uniref:aquaporin AQPAe.a-like isoform X1 n=1 Tax=Eriocheir sinensis TaxID=95602 RepID=UPI0021C926A0|nr:aquaporin AQPAe.a-like isoform X1 [Eriocheir sinensis]
MGKIKDMRDYMGTGELAKVSTWKAVVAELIGTMLLTLIVCGSCITWDKTQPPTIVQISFAVGIIVASMVQAIGHVSGGHINPAVTCGMLVTRYVSVSRALLYIVAQCLGALAGSGILKGITPEANQGNLGMTMLGEGVNQGQAFGVEVLMTFILVLTIFGVCDEHRGDIKGSAPLAIGLAVTCAHLAAIPYTGAAMNPARSFGPAVVTGIWEDHWVYWVGPIAGGVAGAYVYQFLASPVSLTCVKGEGGEEEGEGTESQIQETRYEAEINVAEEKERLTAYEDDDHNPSQPPLQPSATPTPPLPSRILHYAGPPQRPATITTTTTTAQP